ncbi:hypothetical protein J4216_05090 [Candidatus Woesearchaeota archaeon]|nr:hypothetical protein [Candidatus Woesearchaeota archaeon]
MQNKRGVDRLLKILRFIKQINKSKLFFWYGKSLDNLDKIEERLRFLLNNPGTNEESQINDDLFRIYNSLSETYNKFKSKFVIRRPDQDKELDLFETLLKELADYLIEIKKWGNSDLHEKQVSDFEDLINYLKLKYNCGDAREILKKLDRNIFSANGNTKTLLEHEKRFVQLYIEFKESNIPFDFLIEAFVKLNEYEGNMRIRLVKIYYKFLRESYSFNGMVQRMKKGLNIKELKDSENSFIDSFLGDGLGFCFASAYALYQSLLYYGYNAYLVKCYSFRNKVKEYNHAAVIVDLENHLIYLDPGINLEGPLIFRHGSDSDSPWYQTKRIKLVYQHNNEFLAEKEVYSIEVFSAGNWNIFKYFENVAVDPEEFKKLWSYRKCERLKELDKVYLQLNKIENIRVNKKYSRVNLMLNKDKEQNSGQFDYELVFRINTGFLEQKIKISLDPFSLLNLDKDRRELLESFNIDLDRLIQIVTWMKSRIYSASIREAA